MTTSPTPSSADPSPARGVRPGLPAGALLAGALLLFAWGIGWGLPGHYSWAPDELSPDAVADAASRGFSGGWHDKYPPLHFAILAAAEAIGPRVAPRIDALHARFLAGRAVSVLMAVGLLAFAWGITRRSVGADAAPFAVAVLATSAPLVYYAKVANVDVPYLFWAGAALFSLLRAVQEGRGRDYALFGAAAAAALATKDQAYGLFVAPALLLLRDRRVGLAALTGVAAYLVLGNVLLNPAGFVDHLRLITGPASRSFRMFPATPSGELRLLAESARHLAFALGWPALLAAAWGVAGVWRRRPVAAGPRILVAAAVSYVVTFLCVVLYVYDRFLLPVALVLAPFAGRALADAWRAGIPGRVAVVAALTWSLSRAVAVDLLLARDSRYAAEAWLRANAAQGLVAAVGPLEYLPRLQGLAWRRMGPSPDRLQRVAPEFVVTNGDYAQRSDPGTPDHALYAGLEDGSLGYERAFAHRHAPAFSPLPLRDLQRQDAGKLFSNLDKVNPEIRVYRRRAR